MLMAKMDASARMVEWEMSSLAKMASMEEREVIWDSMDEAERMDPMEPAMMLALMGPKPDQPHSALRYEAGGGVKSRPRRPSTSMSTSLKVCAEMEARFE